MIAPIIAAQSSAPIAAIQQNTEAQSTLNTMHAEAQVKKEEQQIKETVVQKDEAVFYEQSHDAKEEGRNKYSNIYSKKKKKNNDEEQPKSDSEVNRINFDIKI
ncbi:MAG: hypothetical protein IJ224_00490 [Lachnospiraceae bacterium]|nr:hypothetical protein [Lachnospiraceae bacterium]